MLLVTAIDRHYLPGLKALHNSMLRNSPDCRMACIVYGDNDLVKEVASRDIEVVANPVIDAKLPVSVHHPVAHPAMYARLLVPWIFNEDAIWLDADQVILKPLNELFTDCEGKVCAAVPSTPLGQHVGGCPKAYASLPGIYAGLIVMRHVEWKVEQITEACFMLMNESTLDFKYVVQSVLGYVLRGNFKYLDKRWQAFGNRMPSDVKPDSCVVHWHGRQRNPWTDAMPNRELWEQYA